MYMAPGPLVLFIRRLLLKRSGLVVMANFDFGVSFPDDDDDSIPDEELTMMMDAEDIHKFVQGQKAKTTHAKERTDLNVFQKYCASINEKRDLEKIPPVILDNILCHFFIRAKTKKGTEYEPDSLTSIRNSLQRILVERKSKLDLRSDAVFSKSRGVLSAKRKSLTKMGKGDKPNACRALSDKEVEFLFKKKYFGAHSPIALARTVWFVTSTCFGHRARDEARQLKFGDISVQKDFDTGEEYLEWHTERSTKTRNGEKTLGHERKYNPPAFATDTERCPVKLFKEFARHRPESTRTDDSPFYLTIRTTVDYETDPVWYFPRPMGKNTIAEFLSKARTLLDGTGMKTTKGKIANHTCRKTSLSTRLQKDVNPLHVQQLSGHKKLESLNSYHVPSIEQQRNMSRIISGAEPNQAVMSKPMAIQPSTVNPQPFNKYQLQGKQSIDFQTQQELSKPWDPVLSLFTREATFTNCKFVININTPDCPPTTYKESTNYKRRRIVIDSDSDED